jgi:hypothetical protein
VFVAIYNTDYKIATMQDKYLFVISFFMLLLALQFTYTPNVIAAPVLKFDKTSYTPFDKVIITLTDSSYNKNSEKIDHVEVTLTGTSASQKITLRETTFNSGVFVEKIRLSPDLSKFPGDMQVRRDDGITASFRIDADNIITESVFIEYHEGTASFDKPSYEIIDEGKITVNDRDADRNPDAPDTIDVRIWSDTDPNGITLTLREIDRNSGVFEERLFFTVKDVSSGNRLLVSDGDVISVRYTDNTLPQPAKLSADGIITLDVKNILATSVFGKQVPMTQRAPASEPVLVDSFGQTVTQVFTGDQVLIQSEVVNTQKRKQPFVYIVQVKDSNGLTASLSWLTAELPPNDSLTVSQSWLPLTAMQYTIEIFVWESTDKPTALSPVRIKNVQVLQ